MSECTESRNLFNQKDRSPLPKLVPIIVNSFHQRACTLYRRSIHTELYSKSISRVCMLWAFAQQEANLVCSGAKEGHCRIHFECALFHIQF